MFRKILKYVLRVILILVGFLLLISILIYLPPVQTFIKNKAASIVASSTGMQLSIDRFRLRFPLTLAIDNTTLLTVEGDTLLRSAEIRAHVALLPLLRKEVQVRSAGLKETAVHYVDTLSQMTLIANLGEFSLESGRVGLDDQTITLGEVKLDRGAIDLSLGESQLPDTAATDTVSVAWKIALQSLELDRIDFRMHTAPEITELSVNLLRGLLQNASLDLGSQAVDVDRIRLEEGRYAYLTDTTTLQRPPVDSLPAELSVPWTIRVNRVELADNALDYGSLYGDPQPGLDFDHLQLSELNLAIDSIYNRHTEVAAILRELNFKERSGLAVTETQGRFVMDTAQLRLSDFRLKTAASSLIHTNALLDAGVLEMKPEAALSATLTARFEPSDLFVFYPADAALRRTLKGQTVTLDGDLSGRLDQIDLHTLRVEMPGHIILRANGSVQSVLDPDHMAGELHFNGNLIRLDFLKPMLSDSMRNRIGFPDRMAIAGSLGIAGQTYSPDIHVAADHGNLAIKGQINLPRERYDAEVTATKFPLDQFLPTDSLGLLTLHLSAKGVGFDPRQPQAAANISLQIDRLDYQGYDYRDMTLDAVLADHLLSGKIQSASDAVQLRFDLTGELRPEKYAARLVGKIQSLDLQELHFSEEPLYASLFLDVSAAVMPDTVYQATVVVDTVRLGHGQRIESIKRINLDASANQRNVLATLRSGDLTLDFNAPLSVDSLLSSLTRTSARVMQQVDSTHLDMQKLQEVLPPFRLEATAGRNNALHSMMEGQGMDFKSISLLVTTLDSRPFRGGLVINSLKTGGLTLDTLNVGFWRKDEQLNYFLRLANRPGNIEQMALIAVSGSVAENQATANFFQRNRSDSVGFRFGIEALLLDSAVRLSLTPERPIFGYSPWKVNKNNYLTYHFNQCMEADLRLEGLGQHVYIESSSLKGMPEGSIRLDMENIKIEEVLGLLPSPPPIGGVLFTDVTFGMSDKVIAATGEVSVDSLMYNDQRVGNIGTRVSFLADELNRWILDAGVSVDKEEVLKASGTYLADGDGSLAFRFTVPSLPLAVANAFMPADMAVLSGDVQGHLALSGSLANLLLNGELNFSGAKVGVPMIGTTFRLSEEPITLDGNKLNFNSFSVISPNNQEFSIDGSVDLGNFSRIYTDLDLQTQDFQVINSSRDGGSQIYGKAGVDVALTVKGMIDALAVRGDVRLLRSTDVTYTLRDAPLEVEDQEQHIVKFVDFSDSTTFAVVDNPEQLRVLGMDMLINIDIEDGVQVTANISEDGNNRAQVVGGGSLTYTMNTQGDTRFSGRYNLSGGTVVYNPPVISPKNFTITDDSYIEWTGEMLNPAFNITAVEEVRTTVTRGDVQSNVTFDISIMIRNSLENIDIVFDLSAPGDATTQYELASLTAEQRSQQAMALLIYNTYTGPGSSATVDTNNPLNSFIAKELNQWARNNLKGVDVSFGINTVDDQSGGQHTDYSYQVSKSLFDDRVKVTIGGSINSDANTTQNLKDNFVDDVTVEYRLTKRDNMFLKAYRYNTQESILEGEVVETGGGFLLRKKMNRMSDLFKLVPSKERRERRERKREIRRQVDQTEEESGVDPAREQRQDSPLVINDDNQEADGTR